MALTESNRGRDQLTLAHWGYRWATIRLTLALAWNMRQIAEDARAEQQRYEELAASADLD